MGNRAGRASAITPAPAKKFERCACATQVRMQMTTPNQNMGWIRGRGGEGWNQKDKAGVHVFLLSAGRAREKGANSR